MGTVTIYDIKNIHLWNAWNTYEFALGDSTKYGKRQVRVNEFASFARTAKNLAQTIKEARAEGLDIPELEAMQSEMKNAWKIKK